MAAIDPSRNLRDMASLMDMDVPMNGYNADTAMTDSAPAARLPMLHAASTYQLSAYGEDSVVAPIREKLQGVSIHGGQNEGPRGLREGKAMHIAAEFGLGRGEVIGTSGNMVLLRGVEDTQAARKDPSRYLERHRRYHDRDGRYYRKHGTYHLPQDGTGSLHDSRYAFQQGDTIMTDFEPRNDYRPRGGGGGYAGRKRRYREDDDQAPPQRYQRREPLSARVKRQILAIAESPMSRPEEDVVNIAKSIADNYEDEKFREIISELLITIAQEQPFKIPFIASLILYTNKDRPEFLDILLTKISIQIQTSLDNGHWRTLKLLLRLLGCLQDVLEGEGIFALLEELFNRAADLQSASTEDALGLELVKIIMLTIPYIMAFTMNDLKEKAAELLEKTDIIASAPRETETIVDPYVRFEGKEAPRLPSYLGMLQKQLQQQVEREWKHSVIPNLFKPMKNEDDLIEMDRGSAGQTHALPEISIPQAINTGFQPVSPEVYFSVYADQDVETVPPTSDIAASLFRDGAVDTINVLEFNRYSAAKALVEIDQYWAPGSFVRRAVPVDKLEEAAAGGSTWKPEDVAVDAIFSQLLQLPAPEQKSVYYHALVTETCKIAPGAIAPTLGRAIRFLYRSLDVLDEELGFRFMDWFTHHLSNFDFRWKWQEWVGDVDADLLNPQKSFITGALDKEIRLTFAQRIRDTLPEAYKKLIPQSKDNEVPASKYNDKMTPFSEEARPLARMIRKREPDEKVEEQLQLIQTKASEPESEYSSDPVLPVVDALMTNICYVGSKTMSHVLSFIERQKDRLMTLSTSSPNARAQIISSIISYWQATQPGVGVNIVDKLLNYTILTPSSVVEWALSPDRMAGGRALAEAWIYELVSRTCGKVTGRVRQLMKARLEKDVTVAQAEMLETTLGSERESMRGLFAIIDDALQPVAESSNDQLLQGGTGMTEPDQEQRDLLRLWGTKWRRVFARKLAVEEALVMEATKSFPTPVEEDQTMQQPQQNGTVVNGDTKAEGSTDMDMAQEDPIS